MKSVLIFSADIIFQIVHVPLSETFHTVYFRFSRNIFKRFSFCNPTCQRNFTLKNWMLRATDFGSKPGASSGDFKADVPII